MSNCKDRLRGLGSLKSSTHLNDSAGSVIELRYQRRFTVYGAGLPRIASRREAPLFAVALR
jgi:hypothetical protein